MRTNKGKQTVSGSLMGAKDLREECPESDGQLGARGQGIVGIGAPMSLQTRSRRAK